MPQPDPVNPDGAFDQVAPEIRRFFASKGLTPSFDYRDVWQDEHALAFTVAKSAGYDILGDVRDAVRKAIEERQDFEDFEKGLEPLLKAKGWWGRAKQIDPLTGKEVEVQLGSARRLQTIYWANVRAARAAGEWEKINRTKRGLPYLLYLISTAEHKRPLHLSWVGTILPVDDPWWDTHYPPNGWNCQCRVRQISEGDAISRGYDPENPLPAPDDGFSNYVNKRTGQAQRIPNGVDPAWASNPGKTRMQNASDLLAGKLDAMDDETRRIATADIAGSWLVERIRSGDIPYDPLSTDPANVERGRISAPIASLPEAAAKAIGAQTRVVSLSVADAVKIAKEHSDLPEDWVRQVQASIDAGAERVQERPNQIGVLFGKFRLLFQSVNKGSHVVLKTIHLAGERYMRSIRRRGEGGAKE